MPTSSFTKATLTSTSNPFTLVNDSANTKYKKGLSSDIIWNIESVIFLELQDSDGTPRALQASMDALQSAFSLAAGPSNSQGKIGINHANFNKRISQDDREAIEKTFEAGGNLYISIAQAGTKKGLPLYVQLLGE